MKYKSKILLKSCWAGMSVCISLGFFFNTVGAISANGCDSLAAAFKANDNSRQKIIMIRQMALRHDLCPDAESHVIMQSLTDNSSSVVEEGIVQAGNGRHSDIAPVLVNLYRNAGRKYPGNQPRLQKRIITALGNIDNKETRELFAQVLSRGNIDANTERVLSSISSACVHDVLPELKSFSQKMSDVLTTMQNTPENSYKYEFCKKLLTMAQTLINKDASR